ncbi:hypothetical protein GQ457_06G026340 [Hibiscus cannabinus]
MPRLRKASRNTGRNVQLWTRRGSPLCALLVISVTTASATIDRLSSHLFGSCGRLLVLFLCLCNSHLCWALSLAAIVISAATISAIFAAMYLCGAGMPQKMEIVMKLGWIGFFWAIWFGTKQSMSSAKQTLNMTGSSAQHAYHD